VIRRKGKRGYPTHKTKKEKNQKDATTYYSSRKNGKRKTLTGEGGKGAAVQGRGEG